jgi:ribonuclease HI
VKGWDGETAPLIRSLLLDIEWWERTIRTNEPRRLRFDPPQVSLYTDASPIGWGAHIHLNSINESVVMHGRWRKKGTSNALECRAVEQAIRKLLRLWEAGSITSILIRSDNTATCYNINRQAAGETLRPALSSLLRFADKAGIQLTAEHVLGVDNVRADRLSRISPGGDYALKPQVLLQVLCSWGKQIDADLFAGGWNTHHKKYCSTAKDRSAIGCNAFNIPWKQFSLPFFILLFLSFPEYCIG